jgi:hypothetical protein
MLIISVLALVKQHLAKQTAPSETIKGETHYARANKGIFLRLLKLKEENCNAIIRLKFPQNVIYNKRNSLVCAEFVKYRSICYICNKINKYTLI